MYYPPDRQVVQGMKIPSASGTTVSKASLYAFAVGLFRRFSKSSMANVPDFRTVYPFTFNVLTNRSTMGCRYGLTITNFFQPMSLKALRIPVVVVVHGIPGARRLQA